MREDGEFTVEEVYSKDEGLQDRTDAMDKKLHSVQNWSIFGVQPIWNT